MVYSIVLVCILCYALVQLTLTLTSVDIILVRPNSPRAFAKMQLSPADVLLSFPEPNYINPQMFMVLLSSSWPSLRRSPSSFALRLYTRLRISTSFGADDVYMLAAVVPTIGLLSYYHTFICQQYLDPSYLGCAIRQNLSWPKIPDVN